MLSIVLSAIALVAFAASVHAHDDDDDDHQSTAPGIAFLAVMTGAGEVPPVSTAGVGISSLLLSKDGATLYYSVEVTGASSTVSAAHIHLGQAGVNGQIVANLCGAGSAPACGTEGVIATGAITAASLVGPLAGHSLADLTTALRSGGAYTNVHTASFPNGELRGQVRTLAALVQQQQHHDDDDDDHDDDHGGHGGGHHGHD